MERFKFTPNESESLPFWPKIELEDIERNKPNWSVWRRMVFYVKHQARPFTMFFDSGESLVVLTYYFSINRWK